MNRKSDKRLTAWLKERLGVKGLVATSPAPVWENDTPDPDLAAKLENLDRQLSDRELSFEPALRYATAPAAETLRLLRQHEGAPAGSLAVLCPESEVHLANLAATVRDHGLDLALTEQSGADLSQLPVSFHLMRQTEIISAADGIVRFQLGADWEDLLACAESGGLTAPTILQDQYSSPADAAEAGFLHCIRTERTAEITSGYEIQLPPAGTRWLDRLWLFLDRDRAFDRFRDICLRNPPAFAQFIGAPAMQAGQYAGFYRLPRKYLQVQDYCAVRLVFQGTSLETRTAAFAASFPLESAWGLQRNGLKLPSSGERTERLLGYGLNIVSVSAQTAWSEIADLRQQLMDVLAKAAVTHSPAKDFTPLSWDTISCTGGNLTLNVTICMPRDFMAPFDQWLQVYKAGLSALNRDQYHYAEEVGQISEESPEWQAIRDALVDENGQLRPLSQDTQPLPDDPRRHHA